MNNTNWFKRLLAARSPLEQPLYPHFALPIISFFKGPPKVFISAEAYKLMLLFVQRAPLEVGWMGSVVREENNYFIDQVFLVKQTVSPAYTDIQYVGLGQLCKDLEERGSEGQQIISRLFFWGHSHVHMDVKASMQDEYTIRQFQESGMAWALRGIFNKCGLGQFSLFLFEDGVRVDDVPWSVYDPVTREEFLCAPMLFAGELPPELVPDEALRAAVDADYEAKVTECDVYPIPRKRQSGADQPVDANGELDQKKDVP